MTVGRRQYNEAEMLQMQREAESRVRELHKRARKTLEEAQLNSSETSVPHPPKDAQQHAPLPKGDPSAQESVPHTSAASDSPKKSNTIIGDIMTALNLDEDYLLIIGLILILINQRADTTLILALVYLLI